LQSFFFSISYGAGLGGFGEGCGAGCGAGLGGFGDGFGAGCGAGFGPI